jgi:hypothetical protein
LKGFVLSSHQPDCSDLLKAVEGFEAKFGRPDMVGGVGFAVPAAVFYAVGFTKEQIAGLYSSVSELVEPAYCATFLANTLKKSGIVFAHDLKTKFCVPVIDILTKTQYSYTNIPSIRTCLFETDLAEKIPFGAVVASAFRGLCEVSPSKEKRSAPVTGTLITARTG